MSRRYTYGVKAKQRPRLVFIVVGLALISLSGFAALNMSNKSESDSLKPKTISARYEPVIAPKIITNYGLPARLKIPKLNVDANVKYLGVDKDGRMGVPYNVKEAGWYKYSSLPGNDGTSVIGGHLTGKTGEPGVFSKIDKLAAGDIITMTDTNGQAINYIVRETKSYDQNAQPDEVFKSTSGSHLNLITCSGSWDKSGGQFTKRLVVFADRVTQ